MAFDDLKAIWAKSGAYPKKTSERFIELDVQQRLLDNTIYSILRHKFEDEYDSGNNYIPVKERRPSLPYNLAKVIVDQSCSLTFGEQHAPSVRVATETSTDTEEVETEESELHKMFERIIEESELDSVMLEAMRVGSVGSVAVILRQMPDRSPWLEVIDSKYCTPYFDPADPRKLMKLVRVFDVSPEHLELSGYQGTYDDKKPYWMMITNTEDHELRSLPMTWERYERLGEEDEEGNIVEWVMDEERSFPNPFSFINVQWIRNLEERRAIDAQSTFRAVADFSIEIAYALSQTGRGYRYTADPLLAREMGELANISPLGGDQSSSPDIVRTPARVLDIPNGGDIKILEISGQGLKGYSEYVRLIREYAFEVVSGMKSDQQHTGGVQSGKALQYLHRPLAWLVSRFRTSYGKRGYLPILKMMMLGIKEGSLEIPQVDPGIIDTDAPLRLLWSKEALPEGADLLSTIQALQMAAGGSPQVPVQLLPHQATTQAAAEAIGITDTNRMTAQLLQERGGEEQTMPQDVAAAQVKNLEQQPINTKESK